MHLGGSRGNFGGSGAFWGIPGEDLEGLWGDFGASEVFWELCRDGLERLWGGWGNLGLVWGFLPFSPLFKPITFFFVFCFPYFCVFPDFGRVFSPFCSLPHFGWAFSLFSPHFSLSWVGLPHFCWVFPHLELFFPPLYAILGDFFPISSPLRKHFVAPELSEGFSQILQIPFVPHFGDPPDPQRRRLFFQFSDG